MITWLSPPPGVRNVAGRIRLEVAVDDPDRAGVRFARGGVEFGAELGDPPFRVDFNTADVAPGVHTFQAIVRTTAGVRIGAPITVTIESGRTWPE